MDPGLRHRRARPVGTRPRRHEDRRLDQAGLAHHGRRHERLRGRAGPDLATASVLRERDQRRQGPGRHATRDRDSGPARSCAGGSRSDPLLAADAPAFLGDRACDGAPDRPRRRGRDRRRAPGGRPATPASSAVSPDHPIHRLHRRTPRRHHRSRAVGGRHLHLARDGSRDRRRGHGRDGRPARGLARGRHHDRDRSLGRTDGRSRPCGRQLR